MLSDGWSLPSIDQSEARIPALDQSEAHLVVDLRPAPAGGAAQVHQVAVGVHLAQAPGEDRAHRDQECLLCLLVTFTLLLTSHHPSPMSVTGELRPLCLLVLVVF